MCTPPRTNTPAELTPEQKIQGEAGWQQISEDAASRLLAAAKTDKSSFQTGQKAPQTDADTTTPWAGNPAFNALAARFAYLGVKGDLVVTKAQALERLQNTGSIGQQLTERLRVMESQGWSMGPMSPNDNFMRRTFSNPIKRLAYFPMIAGHRSDFHGDVQVKRVGYNSAAHLMNQSITSFGRASPASRIVGNIAHELGHWDRIPLPSSVEQLKSLSVPDQKTMGLRLLQTELNAILPQLHVSQKMGVFHSDIEPYRVALREGKLGSTIRNHWIKFGNIYESLNLVTAKEADQFVQKVLSTNYAGVVDKKGNIGAFDLSSVRGRYEGTTAIDGDLLRKIDDVSPGLAEKATLGEHAFFNTRNGRYLARGSQALGALGAAFMISDVGSGFMKSKEDGMGKLGRVGLSLAGYEAGSWGGAMLGTQAARLLAKTGRGGMLTIPLFAIAGGITTSSVTDFTWGHQVETAVKDWLK